MNLRRALSASVVLACILAVSVASPVVDTRDDIVEAHKYEDSDLALRELAANHGASSGHDINVFEGRDSQEQETTQGKKKGGAAKPKNKGTGRPSSKKTATKKTEAKRPGPKKVGNQATKSGTKKPAQKGSPKGASCPIGRKGKRAFDPSCGKAELTLGNVKRSITQVGQQGNSAITYQVDGGWPDPSTGKDVTAYAKTGKTPAETFASEIKWLGKTDQLLAEGKYEGRQFIVFHGVTGKVDSTGTAFWKNLAEKYMKKGDIAGCEAEVKKTLIPLIIREAKVYVDKYHVLHTDIQPGNILWDAAGTDPTLIDWGRAEEVAQWTPEVEKRVRAQAEFSHLKGDEKICHSFA